MSVGLWLSWDKDLGVQKGHKTEVADRFEVEIEVAEAAHALMVLSVPDLAGLGWVHIWEV